MSVGVIAVTERGSSLQFRRRPPFRLTPLATPFIGSGFQLFNMRS